MLYALTGDLTTWGDKESLTSCKLWISHADGLGLGQQQVEKSLLIVPGNHDVLEARFALSSWITRLLGSQVDPLADFRSAFGAPSGIHFLGNSSSEICIVRLDSTIKGAPDSMAGLSGGYFSNASLDALWKDSRCSTKRLSECAARILMIHHHPLQMISGSSGSAGAYLMLQDAPELLRSIVEHGIDMVLHGHEHCAAVFDYTYHGPAKPGPVQTLFVSAASAAQRRSGTGNIKSPADLRGFNTVLVYPREGGRAQLEVVSIYLETNRWKTQFQHYRR